MVDQLAHPRRPGERLLPGTLLSDRYRIESIVGTGAFGVVWRARHVHLDTECAVKLFDPPLGADPQDASARFLQEARVTARLKCPYVAQVFDYGVHQQMPFLVLELLHGASLASRLRALREHGRRMPPAATARILRHVAEALEVAHAAQVVHRDLKPENIFLVQEGRSYTAKVLDFGIAKWSTDAAPHLTATHTLMGTAHYMSPEQFESARHVDYRADLWSLGVMAFECLTGQVPFPGETFIDVAFKVCRQGPLVASKLAAVPAGFDAWFARATALARECRFASALEQALALEQICARATPNAEPSISRLLPGLPTRAAAAASVEPTRAVAKATLLRRFVEVASWVRQFLYRRPISAAFVVGFAITVAAWFRGPDATHRPDVVAPDSAALPEPSAVESLRPRPAPEEPPAANKRIASREPPIAQLPEPPPAVTPARARRAPAPPKPTPPLRGGLETLQRSGPGASANEPGAGAAAGPGLEATAIQRTVRKYSPAVRQDCWQRALSARAPGVPSSAKVTATITVNAAGRVQSVTASGAPRGFPGLARCIEERVRDWAFPRSGGETVTSVPFMFVGP
ncbi:MAG: protein kinase [Deltaproteobacteria bacterium]